MNRFASFLLGTAALLAPSIASAQSIDFNGGTAGSAVGSFYAAQGITFSNARFDSFTVFGPEASFLGGLQITSISTNYQPKSNSAIIVTFDDLIESFSIYGTNVGENGARAEAFDAGGNSLGFSEAFGVDVGSDNNPLLTVTFSGIKSVRLYQPASVMTEGLLWDNMSWRRSNTQVPEPASAALVLTGIAGLVVVRRRKR